jgi:thioredoxin-like negative regulator of GroEL
MSRLQLVLMSLIVSLASPSVFADTPAEIFARGQQLLREGNFDSSAKQFDQATAAAPDNEEYAARAKQLQKVLALQKILDQEQTDGPWTRVARALHLFYRGEKLNDEALKLDRRIHERLDSALSAGILADTLLALGQNDEAAELLGKLPEDKRSLDTDAVRVIALARAGKQNEAIAAADAVKLPDEICAGKAYLLARLNGAVGRNEEAAKYLKQSFESTPPAKLVNFQKAAKSSPDFTGLLADDRYATLWKTGSNPAIASVARRSIKFKIFRTARIPAARRRPNPKRTKKDSSTP